RLLTHFCSKIRVRPSPRRRLQPSHRPPPKLQPRPHILRNFHRSHTNPRHLQRCRQLTQNLTKVQYRHQPIPSPHCSILSWTERRNRTLQTPSRKCRRSCFSIKKLLCADSNANCPRT